MPSILERSRELLDWARSGPASYPTAVRIPANRIIGPAPQPSLLSDQAYFAVTMHQMRLSKGRRWWVDVDPMVLFVSEFDYDGKATAVPTVIGPGMLEKYGQPIPDGFLFEDTVVAGLYPYKGGRVSFTAILYEVPRTNHAKQLLSLVEGAAGLFAAATNLGSYLKVATVVLDGVQNLLGIDGVEPVFGRRHELAPDLGDDLGTGYFALLDEAAETAELGVREHRLVQRLATGELEELKEADYMLYSLRSVEERTDLQQLGFHETVRKAQKLALADASEDGWKRAKAMMVTAFTEIVDSPDLISGQGDALRAEFRDRIKALHEEALATADLSGGVTDVARAARMSDATAVMEL